MAKCRPFALSLALAAVVTLSGIAAADPVVDHPPRTRLVRANSTYSFTVSYFGGEWADVLVSGDGATDLDIFVHDEFGRLVGSDTRPFDDCHVRWFPRRTGKFKISVRNLGDRANLFSILFY